MKRYDMTEFLGMLGVFGTMVSGVQLYVLEADALAAIDWTLESAALFFGFAVSGDT